MALFYVPLEGYKERYTLQWSAPKTGWLERNWIKAGIEYTRIDPGFTTGPRTIQVGSVVDGVGRSLYCFEQIKQILNLVEQGKITESDVIFFDDFWTPGFEALPYAFDLMKIHPGMYAFLHAQSVDEFDFTHKMRRWMRPMETGYAKALDGIFVCCPSLRDQVTFGGIAPESKVHVTGHPFNSEEVMERMPQWYRDGITEPRQNQVVWSSRFDAEKDPHFFLDVIEKFKTEVRVDLALTKFIVCTSAPFLRSNDPQALARLTEYAKRGWVEVRANLSKEDYYRTLCESKVQFNCALQDWVAITLLEASVAGCYPVYPYFRSFPETFLWEKGAGFMYPWRDKDAAVSMICWVMERNDLWTVEKIKQRSWIHRRFDTSWIRMLSLMGVQVPIETLMQNREVTISPYDKRFWYSPYDKRLW